jgi:hypothetical protein
MKNHYRNMLVDIKVEAGQGVPMSVVDAAVAHLRQSSRRRRDSFEKRDEVWVVFDCDEHPEIARALDKARANNVGIAYSNPCFELWGLLHFVDHDAPITRHEVQRRIKEHMPGYDQSKSKAFDYELMREKCVDAEIRAERMAARRMQEGVPRGNPYTSVFELTRLIRKNGTT